MNIQHPFLTFDRQQLIDLRARLQNDESLRTRYHAMIANKEKCLEEALLTEEYANSVYNQHGNYYEVGAQLHRLMTVLGSAYAIDEDRACAEKLTQAMLHLCTFTAWTGPSNKDRDVPWHSDLSTTRIAVELAYGYDLLYDILTEEDRDTIANAIYQKGVLPLLQDWLLPETRIHALDSMGHNWWSVCIALAGVALLPLIDRIPDAEWKPLVEEINRALIGFLQYRGGALFNKVPNYDEKGLFYESVGYFNYGTGELLKYLWHAERYFGTIDDLRAALPEGMSDAILSFAYPCRKNERESVTFLNFGDSALDVNIYGMLHWLPLLGIGTPAVEAYLARTPHEEDMLSLLSRADWKGSFACLPCTALYPASGYAITRSSWENDATLLAVKSGYTWNHAHADAGSFVLFDRGIPLLIDSGACSYGSPYYTTYYRKDDSHNVLLIDGKGQREEEQIRGSKFPGSLTDTYSRNGITYVQADATGPVAHLCSRMYRNFLWLDDGILLIIDDVLCHTNATLQSLLHFNGTYQIVDNAAVTTIDIQNERSRARVFALPRSNNSVTEHTGYLATNMGTTHPKDADKGQWEVPYLCFTSDDRQRVHHRVSAVLLNDYADRLCVEPIEQPEIVGVRLTDRTDGTVRTVYFNERADGRRMHINSNHTLDSWETDAYILMTEQKNDRLHRAFMVCGSYLRDAHGVLHSSYDKITRELLK